MKFRLVLENNTIFSEHGEDTYYRQGDNPIDVIPPINSIIEYIQHEYLKKKRKKYVLQVIKIDFTTTEDDNGSYKNKICNITVKILSENYFK